MKSIINNVDEIILFTNFAKAELNLYNYSKKIHILNHGINKNSFFSINKLKARHLLRNAKLNYNGQFDWAIDLNDDEFIIFNGNRNQPRKRIDITIKAYCEFLKNNNFPKAKLIFNSINDSEHGWNYKELIHTVFYHLNKIENYGQFFHFLTFPQSREDAQLNILYNACDVGINTGDSEGFGLVCFEQASVGVPQIIGNYGGLGDLFDDTCSYLIQSNGYIHHDNTLDGVGGRGWTLSYKDVSMGIEYYYKNKSIRNQHGKNSIKKFEKYNWDLQAKKLYNILLSQ